MTNKGLDWFWLEVILHSNRMPQMWNKRLNSSYKPVFVFTKGRPSRLVWRYTAEYGEQGDKRYHKWGQGAVYPSRILGLLTDNSDIVFDPFTGGGTVPAVCKMLGRRYVAFEIDPDTAARARARVAATQAMHPVFLEEQRELALL